MTIREFMHEHFRHFNAAALVDASTAYRAHVDAGGKMLVTLAGAMSTAELGRSLARMIRAGKVHAISCTGANLEEDICNLVAHNQYERVPNYRDLSPADEQALLERGMNRVTDTCIPEEEAFRRIERRLLDRWRAADADAVRKFPHEFFYDILLSGELEPMYEGDPEDSWMLAAARANLPIVTPGWEDSTMGNVAAARMMEGKVSTPGPIRLGLEALAWFTLWYKQETEHAAASGAPSVGFFQIGGGIAGDFPICAVPLMRQDLRWDVPLWGYFCQISDSTTSYGSYSGAVPNEKITWETLAPDTPRIMIESDATIVAPLIFADVLGL